jgi:ATP adenylyltransferase
VERTRGALETRALLPIETRFDYLEQNGIRFLVRVAESLERKAEDKSQRAGTERSPRGPVNPFLHPEPELLVGDISETHLALLNKFNVIDHHLLLITRRFEDQDCLLTQADFEALWVCMGELDALAFYNGGRVAGASQRHKHLQMIPLPMVPGGPALPIDPIVDTLTSGSGITRLPALPFPHAIARIEPGWLEDPVRAAERTQDLYLALLIEQDIAPWNWDGELRHSMPYNLLITREWMLLVPRARERFGSVSVNALGFAGSFFVKDEQEKEAISKAGPMTVLQHVCPGA